MAGAGTATGGAAALGAAQLIARLLGPMVGATLGQSLQQIGLASNEQKYRDYDIGQFSRQLKDITQNLRSFGDMVGSVTRTMGISTTEQVQAMRTALKYGDQMGNAQSMRTSTQSAQDSLIFAVSNGINRQLYNSLKDIMGQSGVIGSTNAYSMSSSQFERSFARSAQIGNFGMRTQDYLQGAVAYTQQQSSKGIAAFDPSSFLMMQAQIGLAAQKPGQAYLNQFGQSTLSKLSNAFSGATAATAGLFPGSTQIVVEQGSEYRRQESQLSQQQADIRKQMAATKDPLALSRLRQQDQEIENKLTTARARATEAEGYRGAGPYGTARALQNGDVSLQSKIVMDQLKYFGWSKSGSEQSKQDAINIAAPFLQQAGFNLTANEIDALTKIDDKRPEVEAKNAFMQDTLTKTPVSIPGLTPGSTVEQVISGEAVPVAERERLIKKQARATFSTSTGVFSQIVGGFDSAVLSPITGATGAALRLVGANEVADSIQDSVSKYDLNMDQKTKDVIQKKYQEEEMEKAQKAGAPITEAEASQKAQERFKEEARRLTRTGFKYGWSGGNPVEDLKITDNVGK